MELITKMNAALNLFSMLILDPRTGILIGLLLIAAWSDHKTRRIPNWLVFGGAVVGLAYNTFVPLFPGAGLIWALKGLLIGLALFLPFYVLRAMGAGDVKLMAMAGAFLGAPDIIYAVLASFLAGGVLAIGYALAKGAFSRMFANVISIFQVAVFSIAGGMKPSIQVDQAASIGKLPYGIAIAAGTIAYLVLQQFGYL